MQTFQHIVVSLLAYDGNIEKMKENAANIAYADAIRAYYGARSISHFEENTEGTDISHVTFQPISKNIKSKEDIDKNLVYEAKSQKSAKIGEKTHIETFEQYNKGKIPEDLYQGIYIHLTQDDTFDEFVRHGIGLDCSHKYDGVYYFIQKDGTKIKFDNDSIRPFLSDLESYSYYNLAKILYEEYGITANEDWIAENVAMPIHEAYSDDLAAKTIKYMIIPDKIDEYITKHDFSHINEGPILSQKYEEFFNLITEKSKEIIQNDELENNQDNLAK